jgi:hypothetical protein
VGRRADRRGAGDNGGGRATPDIVGGSAIVSQPDAGSDRVTIYFEGAIYDQENVRTLADRANQAEPDRDRRPYALVAGTEPRLP